MVQNLLSKITFQMERLAFLAARWIASSLSYSKEDTQTFKKVGPT